MKIAEHINTGDSRFNGEALKFAEKIISSKEDISCENDGSVNICAAKTPIDEVEFTTRTIRRLVREEGYRYRDFVIIARDATSYEEVVRASAKRNNIVVFHYSPSF